MTVKELVEASVSQHCDAAFLPPEYLKQRAMALGGSDERLRHIHFRRSFVLALLVAVLALALSVTAIAGAAGWISLSPLYRQFGLDPALAAGGESVLAGFIREEAESWNFRRAEAGLPVADLDVLERACRSGALSTAQAYEMFGATAPDESVLKTAEERFPELATLEARQARGKALYDSLTKKSSSGELLASGEESFVLEYAAQMHKAAEMRAQLSEFIRGLLKYSDDSASMPKTLPKEYTWDGKNDLEELSDRAKLESLLVASRGGKDWFCYVLSMKQNSSGYNIKAAFVELASDEKGDFLQDEDGNRIFEFDGPGARPDDFEAEAFMAELPKWSFEVKKTPLSSENSLGQKASHYEDNSFKVISSKLLDSKRQKNDYLFRSTYEYVSPFGERDASGRMLIPFYDEMEALGFCCYDGSVFHNVNAVYDFAEAVKSGDALLVVYSPGFATEYSAADGKFTVRRTDYDAATLSASASRSAPTNIFIEEDILVLCYGSRRELLPLYSETPQPRPVGERLP